MLEANIDAFVTSELQNFQRILSLNDTEESEDRMLEELTREDEGTREAFLKITLSMLRKMREHELADRLQTSKILPTFTFVDDLPDDGTKNLVIKSYYLISRKIKKVLIKKGIRSKQQKTPKCSKESQAFEQHSINQSTNINVSAHGY